MGGRGWGGGGPCVFIVVNFVTAFSSSSFFSSL